MNETGKGGFKDYPEHRNKDGRPKKDQSLTEAVLKKLSKEELAEKIAELIKNGDSTTLRFVYNHIDGMPVQKQILAGDEEQPVRFEIIGGDNEQDRTDGSTKDETRAEGSNDIVSNDKED